MTDDQQLPDPEEGGIWIPPSARTPRPDPDSGPEPAPAGDDAVAEETEQPAETIDYRDRYLRALAECDNIRKRNQQQLELARQRAKQDVLERILVLADGFSRALAAGDEGASAESLRQGLELLASQLEGILADAGVERIPCEVGDEFDPEYHEAMMRGSSEDVPENHITDVIQQGFTLDGRVIRPVRVAVAGPPLDVEAD